MLTGRGVTAGDEVSAFLVLSADTPVTGITVRLRLPPGVTYGGGGKGIVDAKTGLLTWTDLETDRQSVFVPFLVKVSPVLAGALLSLRPEASSGPGYVIAGESASLEASPRQRIERVGPREGTLSAPGGRTHLEFPPDSLAAGLTFTLTEVAAGGAGARPDPEVFQRGGGPERPG